MLVPAACTLLCLTGAAHAQGDIPAVAASTGIHKSLVAALTKANLVSALQAPGPFTVFAPTDDAFAAAGIDLDSFNTPAEIAALANILEYHVYSGKVLAADIKDGEQVNMLQGDVATLTVNAGTVKINDATVTQADVMASNGVIHVVDGVLTPPAPTPAPAMDIPAVAASTGIHKSLVAALTKANLVSALQAPGPFTVFAPTDDAFAAAGIDLDSFNTPAEIAALANILEYHVYSGKVLAADIKDGEQVNMLQGDVATLTVNAGTVKINDATVTQADVMASNGVIHVVDGVLTPPAPTPAPAMDIPAVAASTGIHKSLVAALTKANLVSALQAPGPFTVFAPTDDAFAAAGIDLDSFNTPAEIAALANILEYHVYSGKVLAADIKDGEQVNMLQGDVATLTVNAGTVKINDATVTQADVMASNGVIHVVDGVLTPPTQSSGSSMDLTALWVVLAVVGALALGGAGIYFYKKRSPAGYEAV